MSCESTVFRRSISDNLWIKTARIRSSITYGFKFHFNEVAVNKNGALSFFERKYFTNSMERMQFS